VLRPAGRDRDREDAEADDEGGGVEAGVASAAHEDVEPGEPEQDPGDVARDGADAPRDDQAQEERRSRHPEHRHHGHDHGSGPDDRHHPRDRERQERAPVALAPEERADLALERVLRHQVHDGVIGVEPVRRREQVGDPHHEPGREEDQERDAARPPFHSSPGEVLLRCGEQ
jgi:hypothetical protein